MPVIKYVHVFYESTGEPPHQRIREVVRRLIDRGWKCQSVYTGGGKATAWLVNHDVQPELPGDRPLRD
jgi:hypothetical protein